MVLALVAIPLVVLIEQLCLLELLKAVRQHDITVALNAGASVRFKLDSCREEREQALVDVLMPHNVQDELFASDLVVLVVERISRLLLDVL